MFTVCMYSEMYKLLKMRAFTLIGFTTVGDSEQVCVLLRIPNFRAVFGGPGTPPVIYVTCVTYLHLYAHILCVMKTA